MSVSFSLESLAERITGCLEEARFTLLAAVGGGVSSAESFANESPCFRRGTDESPVLTRQEQWRRALFPKAADRPSPVAETRAEAKADVPTSRATNLLRSRPRRWRFAKTSFRW